MAHRADDFDDDEYLPRADQRSSRGGFPFVVIGAALLCVLLLGVVFYMMSSQRVAERNAVEVAHAEAALIRSAKEMAENRRTNWNRILGTWLREPAGKGDSKYPYRFEFRANLTATAATQEPEGGQRRTGGRVEVFVDNREELAMRLLVGNGMYVYRFRLQDDDTLLLNDGAEGIVFTREKMVPTLPAPPDTPPR